MIRIAQKGGNANLAVSDTFGVADDPKLPFLAQALNPFEVMRQFVPCLSCLIGEESQIYLRAIRVTRYKPGRRCLIEYDLEVEQPSAAPEAIPLVGKVRALGQAELSYHLSRSLWNAGFGVESRDGISVPEPIGVVPEFHMWLQRKVPGTAATHLLAAENGVALARRIAEAAHKLHQTGIPSHSCHTMADELRILHERLPIVAQMKPQWEKRLQRLLDACDRLGGVIPEPKLRGIHRDFYSDQVIVDAQRLYLLDFDLYCAGDPGLDIGNFVGHLTEQSLRTLGAPDMLAAQQEALEGRFVELSGETARVAVRAYAILTLVRHIYLSTQFPERRQFTETLLELCEQRLRTAEMRV